MRTALVLGLLLAAVCPGPGARASLPDIAGLGMRSPALAGTGAAHAEGYEAVYANPAGLPGFPRSLTLGVVYGGYRLELDQDAHPVEPTAGLLLGAALPLPLGGTLRGRVALGLGFYLPFGFINRARDPFAEVPRAALLDSRTQVVSVLLGGAVRLPRGLSIGVGVLALAALTGEIRIAPDASRRITAASQEELVVDYAPIVGLRWQLRPALRLGAVFRGESKSAYDTQVRSELGDVVPVQLPPIRISGVAQYDPLQLAVEAAYGLSAGLLLVANLTWKHWSAYRSPVDPATPGAEAPPDPGFHNTVVPRLALEWLPARERVVVRLGYFYEWSPAPTDATGRALLDADRHVVSAGLSYRLPGRLSLTAEAYLQWHQLAGSERLRGGFALSGLGLGMKL